MLKKSLKVAAIAMTLVFVFGIGFKALSQGPRSIPGVNADDKFPKGCVSCHTVVDGKDHKVSTIVKAIADAVTPELLAKAQASSPEGLTLKGKHPKVPTTEVPKKCMMCHSKTSKTAPAFSRLMHTIHLTGATNMFMSTFQGECGHCHKYDKATGDWNLCNGTE
ncbi:MAG: hypothetical protein NT007_19405 [Candidatus Kapabacteria bacterium]|nr:hypothetical protein [Candidatus Kapabacteria bacterium]